uniref:Uncharacterized protein n=1 Tax=Lepeophtheirus salmonis TaxID=72036 RepID=A0A0K2UJY6_LEPSM
MISVNETTYFSLKYFPFFRNCFDLFSASKNIFRES